MESLEQIIETGSFTSKERLTETITALNERVRSYRERAARGVMSVTTAANEIYVCNNWIECFKELKNSL